MPPEHPIEFGGGATQTTLHPIVLVAMLLAIILIFILPRKYVLAPLLFVAILAPFGQQVVLGGVHWFVFRILVLCGCGRLLVAALTSPSGVFAGGINPVDRAFFWCTIITALAVILRFHQMAAVINQGGYLLDYLGGYFLFRALIRDEEDIRRAIKCFAFIALVVAIGMAIEQVKQVNVFGILGGHLTTPDVREGRIRSSGPFGHEILAGTLGATLLPLFLLLGKNTRAKFMAAVGLVGATVMMVTSNSATPLLAYAGGLLAVAFWPVRKNMRTIRWGIVVGLMLLQLVMKAPFWFVIAHIKLVPGSSSWHRAEIVDLCIRHFFDWWLIGTKNTGEWGFWMWDTQDQFVSVAERGGLAGLIFFVLMISRCFGRLGKARKAVEGDTEKEWFLWFLCAALFSHVTGFFGVNYFDQTVFAWFALLAMISAATAFLDKPTVKAEGSVKAELVDTPMAYSSS
jgi:hypothetical protein